MSAKYKPPLPPKSETQLSQADKFREAARELETDDDEKRFDERLKKLVNTVNKEKVSTTDSKK